MNETGLCGPPLFSLHDVSAVFDGKRVLAVERLEIRPGQVTVLLGENGSGKTTLLRLLNGLIPPSAGTVSYLDLPLTPGSRPRLRAESVLVHQEPLLFRGTALYNAACALRLRGSARTAAAGKAAAALSRVGMAGLERRRVSGLSGGEKQRVALARALALNVKVLLLDEPTANIDPETRRLIENFVREEAASGATVIASSNDREFAYRTSDRILILESGGVFEGRENVLRGVVAGRDEQFVYFKTGACLVKCPARDGNFSVAVLPLEDVILSREPLVSSARNRLQGSVLSVEPESRLLRVTVDCGAPVQALITAQAAKELGIEKGRECAVTFKASAVRLY
jgi:tungstate transport system ATP-binding protein